MELLGKLFDGALPDYLRACAETYPLHSSTWMLIHIPKTAGSSFRQEMADVMQPDVNVEADYEALAAMKSPDAFEGMILQALDGLRSTVLRTHIPFASGHVTLRQAKSRLEPVRVAYTTILRDPVRRLISDYLHRTSTSHPLHELERTRFPTFRHFIEDPHTQNQLSFFLCPAGNLDAESALKSIYENFAFVGVQELYPVSLKVQMALLGCRARTVHQLRKSSSASANSAELVSAEDIDAARSLNALDIAIYDHFLAQWQAIVAGVHYHIDYDRAFKMLAGLKFHP